MVRTQIYLTEAHQRGLQALSSATGRSQSELIREAIDALLTGQGVDSRRALLAQARGLWKDRNDLPDPRALRDEWAGRAPGEK